MSDKYYEEFKNWLKHKCYSYNKDKRFDFLRENKKEIVKLFKMYEEELEEEKRMMEIKQIIKEVITMVEEHEKRNYHAKLFHVEYLVDGIYFELKDKDLIK